MTDSSNDTEIMTTSLAFTAFQIFCDKMDSVKYIYPSFFKAVYMVLTHVTVDGKQIEYTQEILDSFKKAVRFIFFIDDSEDSEEYKAWDNREWFDNLPINYKEWSVPTNNYILYNALPVKLDL